MAELSYAQLNRATLARQMLLRREAVDPAVAVRRLCALQAQAPASPYLALWTRLDAFDAADLDRAFDDGTVVKTTLMRTTLHAVAGADHPLLWAAHEEHLRRRRPGPALVTELGVTEEQVTAALHAALAHAHEPRTGAEMSAHLRAVIGPVKDPGWWWAVLPFARVTRVPDTTAWRFGARARYRTAVPHPPVEQQESLRYLVRSYLRAFGPATLRDLARFTRLPMGTVRPAAEQCDDLLTHEGPGGQELYDVPGAPLPDGATPAPVRFLPMWDSVLLAYADGRRLMSVQDRKLVVRTNGDYLPTVLVDGYVAGMWLPAEGGTEGGIEVRAFRDLDAAAWAGLAVEAEALQRFLGPRERNVYSRYRHYLPQLAALETRTLGRAAAG